MFLGQLCSSADVRFNLGAHARLGYLGKKVVMRDSGRTVYSVLLRDQLCLGIDGCCGHIRRAFAPCVIIAGANHITYAEVRCVVLGMDLRFCHGLVVSYYQALHGTTT